MTSYVSGLTAADVAGFTLGAGACRRRVPIGCAAASAITASAPGPIHYVGRGRHKVVFQLGDGTVARVYLRRMRRAQRLATRRARARAGHLVASHIECYEVDGRMVERMEELRRPSDAEFRALGHAVTAAGLFWNDDRQSNAGVTSDGRVVVMDGRLRRLLCAPFTSGLS